MQLARPTPRSEPQRETAGSDIEASTPSPNLHFPDMDYDTYVNAITPLQEESKTSRSVPRQRPPDRARNTTTSPLSEKTAQSPEFPFSKVDDDNFARTVAPGQRVAKVTCRLRPHSSASGAARQLFDQRSCASTPSHSSKGCPQVAPLLNPPVGASGPRNLLLAPGRPPDVPVPSQRDETAPSPDPDALPPGPTSLTPASGRPPEVSAQSQQGKAVPSLDPDTPLPGPSGQAPASGRPPEFPGSSSTPLPGPSGQAPASGRPPEFPGSCSTPLPGPSGQAPASGRPPEPPGGCSNTRPGDTPPPPVLTPAEEGTPPSLNNSKGARPPPLLSPIEPQSPHRTILTDPPQTGAVPIEGSPPLSTSTPERNAPHPQRPPGPLHINGEDPAPLSDSDTTLVYPQGDQEEPEGEEEVTICCTLYDKGDGGARGPGPPRVPTGRDGLH